MTMWTRDVMWWQVYPLGFTGAPVRPDTGGLSGGGPATGAGRLRHIEAWLDHVVELGLNGLSLGPIFASESHGYDTTDYFAIDRRLGDDADFDHLVSSAKERGIRIILDGVFNHVGRTHPAFAEVTAHGPDASTADMFRVDWTSWKAGSPVPAHVFEGHDGLVSLNHESEQVVELVASAMTHWLDRGIDGWRLDAAYAVPPGFWTRVLPRVREQFPDAWFTGEVIHGDAIAIASESGMDSLTQYELWQGIWHSFADENLYELGHALERHNSLLATFVPSTFVGNHDVTRIASAVGHEHVAHALAVMLAVAGVPTVYSGDEYGYTAIKEERVGGDDAVRPEFPETPPGDDELDETAAAILRAHRQLIALRRRHPWLHRAATEVALLDNRQLVMRSATEQESVIVALNIGDEDTELPALDARETVAGDGRLVDGKVELPPHGWSVMTGGH